MANEILQEHINKDYEWGFITNIDSDTFAPGLNEQVVTALSKKKNEPDWLLEFRLKAFRHWQTLPEPNNWAHLDYPKINYEERVNMQFRENILYCKFGTSGIGLCNQL